ncbi:Fe2+-dependent dioxygenase [Microbulbifer pacificus]|uniref:Fe2+-dependent dioxygenase n=1 Tax=Microbulbifer pacificus TaxID=407164 RepID=UPI000CF46EA3|nr:Fe2+-dependent dioxygenase [Microbulbifer pacificus]
MLLEIPEILSSQQAANMKAALLQAEWVDGRVTAGHQSAQAKKNRQLPENAPLARELGDMILRALPASALFMSAALPQRVFPPLFNCYEGGEHFNNHVDNAIRRLPTGGQIRTDLSCTLFLSEPDEYDGGELLIDDTYGAHSVKLPAGSLVLYPSTSLHRVTPVTRGSRVSSFFWIQSLVRDDGQRTLLFDLDMSINRLRQELGDHEAIVAQTGVYHNLLRRWSEP